MKNIHVVAAIIQQDNHILATQRGYGDFAGGWEFPGGKVEAGESSEAAIIREIKEELDTEIIIDRFFTTIEYDYPTFHLSMDCFLCSIKEGSLTLLEHRAAKWLDKNHLNSVNWLPADITIIEMLRAEMSSI